MKVGVSLRRSAGAVLVIATWLSMPAGAQAGQALVLDETVAPGTNYDVAEFRYWQPVVAGPLRGVVVLVPGSNGDGRPMAEDAFWQALATRYSMALVACRFTDRPHDQAFIEEYVDVSRGSGQALVDALGAFARRANRPEVAGAPLLLWGMSAGGQFNYEFAAWKPERVIAFVVNKGGIYYSALVPEPARRVPALLFVGEKDLAFRTNTIVGLFAVNRRAGALWALVEEPDTAHVVGRSRDLSAVFFDDVLAMRLGPGGLAPVEDQAGFIGDLGSDTFQPVAGATAPAVPTAWLPAERTARAWRAVVTGKPFEP
ncbi:MAG: alpha/beta hydrolase [Acidobacteriota bacterium]|nr:alpha/beta hydrolase [Acidobacteriota bacterium]